jgi:hypothetical protein
MPYILNPGVVSNDTYTPDALIASQEPGLVTDSVTIISGQNLLRGTVLGVITSSGKYTLALAASADGSQNPYAILAADTNASGGDTLAPVYVAGKFNTRAMTFGTGVTAVNAAVMLRDCGIYLATAQSATLV